MFNEFKEWVESVLGNYYAYSQGMWVETQQSADKQYVVIQAGAGSAPDVEDRRTRYRVIFLGRRDQRQDANGLYVDANTLIAEAMVGLNLPCGAANVRAMTEATGPGFTAENRAWFQVDFEVLF